MNLQNITQYIRKGEPVILQEICPDSIEIVNKPVFYITPQYNEIHSITNPEFIVFSATGATGKTALAKYISNEYNAVYWNLAKILLVKEVFMAL